MSYPDDDYWCEVDSELMNEVRIIIASGQVLRFEDCLITPSGTKINGILNAKRWGVNYRIRYWYDDDINKQGEAIMICKNS